MTAYQLSQKNPQRKNEDEMKMRRWSLQKTYDPFGELFSVICRMNFWAEA